MAVMSHRTTFALDHLTVGRLRKLAVRWGVSQAEVVRRAVELAERTLPAAVPAPEERLRELHRAGGGLAREEALEFLADVRRGRHEWRGGV